MTKRTGQHDVPSDINVLTGIRPAKRADEIAMPLFTSNFTEMNLSGYYAGRAAFLIGGGPSLNDHDLSLLRNARGIVTMGMNNSWGIYKPDLWTCVDGPGRFFDTGWKDPSIQKYVPMSYWNSLLKVQKANGLVNSAFRVWQMPSVSYFLRSFHYDPKEFLTEDRVCWGGPGNHRDALGINGKRSVFMAALKLLTYLGFKKIYCIGTDFKMSETRKYAFGEERSERAIKHNNCLYDALIKRMDALNPYLKQRGIRIRVCCPDSGLLKVWPFMEYEEAIEEASAECSKPVNPKGWYK